MALFLAKTNGVTGFYDDHICAIPPLNVALTQEQYTMLLGINQRGARLDIVNTGTDAAPSLAVTVADWAGKAIDLSKDTPETYYWPPAAPIPLKDQAKAAMQVVMASTQSHGWGVFSPMPDDVTAYGKALSAIISGADTTSTTLPAKPAELG